MPHVGQARGSALPQFMQNLAPAGFSVLHTPHVIEAIWAKIPRMREGSEETAEKLLALGWAWTRAVNAGDLEALIEMSTEDVVLIPRLVAVEGGDYHGHDGVRRWFRERSEIWREMIGELTDMRAVDDAVVGTGTLRGISRVAEITVDQPIFGVIRFRGERAYWIGFFRTEAEALDASGLSG